jgi:hypothetical protein
MHGQEVFKIEEKKLSRVLNLLYMITWHMISNIIFFFPVSMVFQKPNLNNNNKSGNLS